jgi:hypothetical protein
MFIVTAVHASEAVGAVKLGVAGQEIVPFAPGTPIVGVGQVTVTNFSQNCVPKSGLSNVMSICTVKLVAPALTVTVPWLFGPTMVAAPLGTIDHTKCVDGGMALPGWITGPIYTRPVAIAHTGVGPVIVQGNIALTGTVTVQVVEQFGLLLFVAVTVKVIVWPWSVIAAV